MHIVPTFYRGMGSHAGAWEPEWKLNLMAVSVLKAKNFSANNVVKIIMLTYLP